MTEEEQKLRAKLETYDEIIRRLQRLQVFYNEPVDVCLAAFKERRKNLRKLGEGR